MIKLVVSTFVENGTLVLQLNEKTILNGTGKTETNIEKNKDYILAWKVKGKVGSSFTISVSFPTEAEFMMTKNIGKTGEDSSSNQFST